MLLKKFFWFCSGATSSLLEKSPTEHSKYVGIGATILFTGILAGISGGYALYTVFDDATTAIIFGTFWGMIIFNLDRLVVAGIKKEGFFIDLIRATPRLILAGILAVVISQPLELKIFEKEISAELQRMQREMAISFQNTAGKEFAEIDKLEAENKSLKDEIKSKEKERTIIYDAMIAEAEGTKGTGRSGKGPLYKEKKIQFEKIEKELNFMKEVNLATIKRNEGKLDKLYSQKDEMLATNKKTVAKYDGFLARFEALHNLTSHNATLKQATKFVSILFIMVEITPMLVKLMAPRGPYDDLIAMEEAELSAVSLEVIQEIDNQQEARKEADRMISHARTHMLKRKIKQWHLDHITNS